MTPSTAIEKATRWYPPYIAVSGLLAALFVYVTKTELVGHLVALTGFAVAVVGLVVFATVQKVTPKHGKWDETVAWAATGILYVVSGPVARWIDFGLVWWGITAVVIASPLFGLAVWRAVGRSRS